MLRKSLRVTLSFVIFFIGFLAERKEKPIFAALNLRRDSALAAHLALPIRFRVG
jgi:hypothetical protein